MKTTRKRGVRVTNELEWPTLVLIGLMYIAFLLLTWFYTVIPLWLLIPAAGFVLALYSSLQHEVLHGHPTPWQRLNETLLFPVLNLWLPYPIYRDTHLQHHNNQYVTDPKYDPESFYVDAASWQLFPAWRKGYHRVLNTFAGRLLLGPLHSFINLMNQEVRTLCSGDLRHLRVWIIHFVSCALVLYWVMSICSIAFWEYLLFFVYPGMSLALVRSFLEHQAVEEPAHRSVIVESNALLSLLFLNNNLHAIHHAKPGLAWYRLPKIWREQRESVLAGNGAYYFSGYGAILRQYWNRAKEHPCYPL